MMEEETFGGTSSHPDRWKHPSLSAWCVTHSWDVNCHCWEGKEARYRMCCGWYWGEVGHETEEALRHVEICAAAAVQRLIWPFLLISRSRSWWLSDIIVCIASIVARMWIPWTQPELRGRGLKRSGARYSAEDCAASFGRHNDSAPSVHGPEPKNQATGRSFPGSIAPNLRG